MHVSKIARVSSQWTMIACTVALAFLIWSNTNERCDAATTFLPQISHTKPTKRSTLSSDVTQTTNKSQLRVVTDPFASMDFWLPTSHHDSRSKKTTNDAWSKNKNIIAQSTISLASGFESWMELLHRVSPIVQVSFETVLVLGETFTKQILNPSWKTVLDAIEEQMLHPAISNVVTSSTAIVTTNDDEIVDPGEFLCEHDNWQAYFDHANTCLIYYFHTTSGASQWDPPFPNYPIPILNTRQYAMVSKRYNTINRQQQFMTDNHQQLDTTKSDDNPVLTKNVFQGIQDLLFQNIKKVPGKKPDTEEDEDTNNNNNKPWLLSMMENVFESTGIRIAADRQQHELASVEKEQKNLGDGDALPFFAAFQDQIEITPTALGNVQNEEPTDPTTTLSPWWEMLVDVVKQAAILSQPIGASADTKLLPKASTSSSSMKVQPIVSVDSQLQKQQQRYPWDFFFPVGNVKKELETAIPERTGSSFSTVVSKSVNTSLKTTIKSPDMKQQRMRQPNDSAKSDIVLVASDSVESSNSFVGWMNDLPLFLTRDASRTIPLFGLLEKSASLIFPKNNNIDRSAPLVSPSVSQTKTTAIMKDDKNDRLKALEAKRYAASQGTLSLDFGMYCEIFSSLQSK
jgi:hypothetical protein